MSAIPPNILTSVAQAQLTQQQRGAEADAATGAAARQADRTQRLRAENREFVEDMAAATGLKVDPDGRGESEAKRKKRQLEQHARQQENPAPQADSEEKDKDTRARSAALLANPESQDNQPPPPLMLDIEA